MSHSTLAAIIVPIVALIALAVWIVLVYRADQHPGTGRRLPRLRREVNGGTFESTGGRQVTPTRDAAPREAAQYEDQYEQSSRGSSDSG
jgi:hypothetical protein